MSPRPRSCHHGWHINTPKAYYNTANRVSMAKSMFKFANRVYKSLQFYIPTATRCRTVFCDVLVVCGARGGGRSAVRQANPARMDHSATHIALACSWCENQPLLTSWLIIFWVGVPRPQQRTSWQQLDLLCVCAGLIGKTVSDTGTRRTVPDAQIFTVSPFSLYGQQTSSRFPTRLMSNFGAFSCCFASTLSETPRASRSARAASAFARTWSVLMTLCASLRCASTSSVPSDLITVIV